MRMQGRRASSNVRDIRGKGGMKMAGGLGLGGLLLVALFAYMTGGNPLNAVLNAVVESGGGGIQAGQTAGGGEYKPTAEEQELAEFSAQVLAGTEDVWSGIFREMGRTYEPPTLVLFTDSVQSGCGGASKQVGPFYCSADKCLYIDLSFFSTMREQLGADGDFAYAYVIGHEVGHHVQNMLGILGEKHKEMARLDKEAANRVSVRLELQADFLAGVWAHHDNARFGSLEDGDIEEAIRCAQVIGDDYLQKKARGYVQPENFTHGTSQSRMRWFKKGLDEGRIQDRDLLFKVRFEDL
ncbi:MAG: neutral zinc metallopeptidase [Kiritimatiellae bacterium]|nr:neutral zinc metallopeptidase [Kiritimatiellia bacterium]